MILNKAGEENELESVVLTKQDVESTKNEIQYCLDWLNMAADFVPHNERAIRIIQRFSLLQNRFDLLLKYGDLPDDLNVARNTGTKAQK